MRQQFTQITRRAARQLALCLLGGAMLSGCGAEGSSSPVIGRSDAADKAEVSAPSPSREEGSPDVQSTLPASSMEASTPEASQSVLPSEQKSQEASDGASSAEASQDSIFISDEVYMDVTSRVGDAKALQLRTFAESYIQWLPEDWELSPGVVNFAVYDLDGDGSLELLRSQIQGTGLFAFNAYYHADVENGQVSELEQQTDEDGFALEIASGAGDRPFGAYRDSHGRIFYLSSDYGRAGTQFSACTDGCFYLENDTVISLPIRSRTAESNAAGEWAYTYYLPGQEAPISEAEWEDALQTFLTDKTPVDAFICWKSLYVDEITEKKVQGWFLLLTESLEEAISEN